MNDLDVKKAIYDYRNGDRCAPCGWVQESHAVQNSNCSFHDEAAKEGEKIMSQLLLEVPCLKESVRVAVTNANIKTGLRGDSEKCPVALSLLQAGFEWARVYAHSIVLHRAKRADLIETPGPVRDFVQKFDRGDPVDPFDFELIVE